LVGLVTLFLCTALLTSNCSRFRWVACQLAELSKCLKASSLRNALQELPKTLDETYDRILTRIPDEYCNEAHSILQWIAYSACPMSLSEVAEAIVINPQSQRFSPDDRLFDIRYVLEICSSLLTLSQEKVRRYDRHVTRSGKDDLRYARPMLEGDEDRELRLAHYSVKEYLVSDRIKLGPASKFHISENEAHELMTKASLTYLSTFDQPISISWSTAASFPLIQYAGRYWAWHYRAMSNETESITSLAMSFLDTSTSHCFSNWLKITDPDSESWDLNLGTWTCEYGQPLYYVALLGLTSLTERMIKAGSNIHAIGGHHKYALCAASYAGHKEVVRLLLENGADIDCIDDNTSNTENSALMLAIDQGHEEVACLFLEKGININFDSPGAYGTNALEIAATRGNESLVKLLLDHGAEPGPQWMPPRTLRAAARSGNIGLFNMLLEKYPKIKNQGELYNDILQYAASSRNTALVQTLLGKGANVNAQVPEGEPYYGSALGAAVTQQDEGMTRLLLENHAIVDCNVLQSAAAEGKFSIFLLLMEKFLSENGLLTAKNAILHEAAAVGSEEIVLLLLRKGVDVNTRDDVYGTALQAAAEEQNENIVSILLDHGADVNIAGVEWGCALQAAADQGSDTICTMLLDHGANVNLSGGRCGHPLQAAATSGNTVIVEHLLEKGAAVNAIGGRYGTALQAAMFDGHIEIGELLLSHGADLNVQGGRYGSALQAAALSGYMTAVTWLLDNGADINLQCKKVRHCSAGSSCPGPCRNCEILARKRCKH
jgi:ankyrin repeat protein